MRCLAYSVLNDEQTLPILTGGPQAAVAAQPSVEKSDDR